MCKKHPSPLTHSVLLLVQVSKETHGHDGRDHTICRKVAENFLQRVHVPVVLVEAMRR